MRVKGDERKATPGPFYISSGIGFRPKESLYTVQIRTTTERRTPKGNPYPNDDKGITYKAYGRTEKECQANADRLLRLLNEDAIFKALLAMDEALAADFKKPNVSEPAMFLRPRDPKLVEEFKYEQQLVDVMADDPDLGDSNGL